MKTPEVTVCSSTPHNQSSHRQCPQRLPHPSVHLLQGIQQHGLPNNHQLQSRSAVTCTDSTSLCPTSHQFHRRTYCCLPPELCSKAVTDCWATFLDHNGNTKRISSLTYGTLEQYLAPLSVGTLSPPWKVGTESARIMSTNPALFVLKSSLAL
jgi:hypothetical protein